MPRVGGGRGGAGYPRMISDDGFGEFLVFPLLLLVCWMMRLPKRRWGEAVAMRKRRKAFVTSFDV